MTIPAANVLMYAATTVDFQLALGAAAASGVPVENVIGNFSIAWTHVQSGGAFVVAVGRDALNALYYNPCNWANPASQPGGHTPFDTVPDLTATIPQAGYFVNGAGHLAQDTYKLSAMLAYHAVHGAFPSGMTKLPSPIAATESCDARASADVPCPC